MRGLQCRTAAERGGQQWCNVHARRKSNADVDGMVEDARDRNYFALLRYTVGLAFSGGMNGQKNGWPGGGCRFLIPGFEVWDVRAIASEREDVSVRSVRLEEERGRRRGRWALGVGRLRDRWGAVADGATRQSGLGGGYGWAGWLAGWAD